MTIISDFQKDWRYALARRKKFLAYLSVMLGAALDYGVIPNAERGWVLLGLLIAGAPAVHNLKNAPVATD